VASPTPAHKIEWLLESTDSAAAAVEVGAAIETKRVQYPYPAGWAQGYSSHTQTSDGMVLVRSSHRFNRDVCPPEISLGRFSVAYDNPVLGISLVHRGSLVMSEPDLWPERVRRVPGVDGFAHVKKYSVEETFDTASDLDMTGVLIPMNQMTLLMGEDLSYSMLKIIGITALNSVNPAFKVPLTISQILGDCLDDRLTGPLKALRLHAGILDYLCSLSIYLNTDLAKFQTKPAKSKAKTVHKYLLSLGRETPTLNSLGKHFGVTPNQLNKEFIAEYGESIFSFLTNHRLEQARHALELGSQSIKGISHAIGYAHVNNFIAAFRRKFGRPPGAFRSNYKTGSSS